MIMSSLMIMETSLLMEGVGCAEAVRQAAGQAQPMVSVADFRVEILPGRVAVLVDLGDDPPVAVVARRGRAR